MRRIIVEDGYKCPLCPDHWDDPNDFEWSDLLGEPICAPCGHDIHNAFGDEDHGYDPVPRILELTGLTYPQAKFIYLRRYLVDCRQKVSRALRSFDPLRADEAELHAWNILLDGRVTRLCMRAVDFRFAFRIAWHDDPAIFATLARVRRSF